MIVKRLHIEKAMVVAGLTRLNCANRHAIQLARKGHYRNRGWKETIELEQDTKSEKRGRINQESHSRNIPVEFEAIPSRAAYTDIDAEKE